jgi:hypothetical protein
MPQVIKGSYISTGVATPLNLVIDPDFVEVFIQGDATGSEWNSVANPGHTKRASWFKGMARGSAFTVRNTDGAATDQSTFITANGFYPYTSDNLYPNPAYPNPFFPSIPPFIEIQTDAPVVGTAVTQAAQAVVTSAGHPFVVGDRLVISTVTGMEQINGLTVSVVAVNPGVTYTISVNSAAFAAPGTAITARRIRALPEFEPRACLITSISLANPMVVTLTETHNFHVGSIVRFKIPTAFGMPQLNDQYVEITAVGAQTLTFGGFDSTGFTAFAYPAAAGVPFTFPQVVPAAEDSSTLVDSIANTGFRGLILGTSVCGPNGAKVYYTATKADAVQ